MSDDTDLHTESAWARGYRDFKAGIGHWAFWATEGVGGTVLGIYAQPIVVVVYLVGVAVALWLGATAYAPVRQRNEARNALSAITTPGVEFGNLIAEALGPSGNKGEKCHRIFFIEIKTGDGPLNDCVAYLLALGVGDTSVVGGGRLPLPLSTQGQVRDGNSGPFKLRRGHPKLLRIAEYNELGKNEKPRFLVEKSHILLPSLASQYKAKISLQCESGPPIYVDLLISAGGGKLNVVRDQD